MTAPNWLDRIIEALCSPWGRVAAIHRRFAEKRRREQEASP
jgi:hypothetical protein